MMAFLLFNRTLRASCLRRLVGGSLANFATDVCPTTTVTAIEVNPDSLRSAKNSASADDDRFRVICADGGLTWRVSGDRRT